MATLSPKLTFNRITGKIILEDLTNYPALGIDFNVGDTAEGYIAVAYDIGAGYVYAYNNLGGTTPDVSPATSTLATADINIPLDDNGVPLAAAYRLTYRVNVVPSGGAAYTIEDTFNYTYGIVDPVACLDVVVNCAGSAITSTDDTVYTQDNATISSMTRAHTLYPPPASGQSVMTANLKQLIYTPIATTTWTAEIITTVTYLQNDGLYITMQVIGSLERKVQCDTSLADVLCCIYQLFDTYTEAKSNNTTLAQQLFNQRIEPTQRALLKYLTAQQSGNITKMASAYDELIAASGCSTDCGCSGDVVTIVQATDSGNSAATIYVVDSPDASISVVQDVVGSTTTYHIQVSAALQAAIAAAGGNVAITTTTASSLEIQNPSPGTFVINYIGETFTGFNLYSKQFAVRKNSGAGNYYLLEAADIIRQGSIWNTLGSQTQVFGAQSGLNTSTNQAVFYLQDFFVGQSIPPIYTATANIMRAQSTAPATTKPKLIECEVFWFDYNSNDGDLRLRLYEPSTGLPYTLADLDALVPTGERLYIQVTMTAVVSTGSGS